MNLSDLQSLEKRLSEAGRSLRYPATPPIAAAVMRRIEQGAPRRIFPRRLAWAVVAALVLFSALMLVPPARAAILDFIQIGVVRIFRGPNPPPIPAPTASLSAPAVQIPLTATPAARPEPTATATSAAQALADFAGETTLAKAQQDVKFRILLPTYPTDLGQPDRVYLQHPGDSMVVLVWLDPAERGRVRMSLHEISPGRWAVGKFNPPVVQEVRVNGRQAGWTVGPYLIELRNGDFAERRLITGHVLIWEQGSITYRLETDLPVQEAIRVAEALKPAP
jgi:hypothetical protein